MTPEPPFVPYSVANDINNAGLVVGIANEMDAERAVLWDETGARHNLSALIASGPSGWTLLSANAINERGQIVGIGRDPSGIERGFVLTPIPEPAGIGLIATGVMSITFAARRRRRG